MKRVSIQCSPVKTPPDRTPPPPYATTAAGPDFPHVKCLYLTPINRHPRCPPSAITTGCTNVPFPIEITPDKPPKGHVYQFLTPGSNVILIH